MTSLVSPGLAVLGRARVAGAGCAVWVRVVVVVFLAVWMPGSVVHRHSRAEGGDVELAGFAGWEERVHGMACAGGGADRL